MPGWHKHVIHWADPISITKPYLQRLVCIVDVGVFIDDQVILHRILLGTCSYVCSWRLINSFCWDLIVLVCKLTTHRTHSYCHTALFEISKSIVGKILPRTIWYHYQFFFRCRVYKYNTVVWSLGLSGAEMKYGVPTERGKWCNRQWLGISYSQILIFRRPRISLGMEAHTKAIVSFLCYEWNCSSWKAVCCLFAHSVWGGVLFCFTSYLSFFGQVWHGLNKRSFLCIFMWGWQLK